MPIDGSGYSVRDEINFELFINIVFKLILVCSENKRRISCSFVIQVVTKEVNERVYIGLP